jgi:hypothetical protein
MILGYPRDEQRYYRYLYDQYQENSYREGYDNLFGRGKSKSKKKEAVKAVLNPFKGVSAIRKVIKRKKKSEAPAPAISPTPSVRPVPPMPNTMPAEGTETNPVNPVMPVQGSAEAKTIVAPQSQPIQGKSIVAQPATVPLPQTATPLTGGGAAIPPGEEQAPKEEGQKSTEENKKEDNSNQKFGVKKILLLALPLVLVGGIIFYVLSSIDKNETGA